VEVCIACLCLLRVCVCLRVGVGCVCVECIYHRVCGVWGRECLALLSGEEVSRGERERLLRVREKILG